MQPLDRRISDLDGKVDREVENIRKEFHRSMYRLFAGMTLVFVVISVAVQIFL